MKILRILLCLLMLAPNAYSWDLSDPGEDKIMGWDNSASAADKMSWFGVSQGLSFNGTNIVPTYGTTASTVAEGNHTHSAVVSDTAYSIAWDEVTGVAPSKNALYDYLSTLALSSHNHSGVYELVGVAAGLDHAAITLDSDAAVIFDLSTQEIGLDVQNANTVFAGPATGVANEPTFRALVAADLPEAYEPADITILKADDIGVSVMAHAATASQAEMEEGTKAALRAMSPLSVAQAIAALAGVGTGDLLADGTIPLTADWNVGAFGITAESFTAAKTSGVAGDFGLYEANSTDTDAAGFRGPASMGDNTSYRIRLPAAKPTSRMSLTVSGTVSTGSGPPSNPYILDGSWHEGEVNGSAAITPLSAEQMSSSIIYNTGQTTADVTITAGTAAAGYNMLFTVGTTQAANDWKFRAAANDKVYAVASDGSVTAGSDNGYFGFSTPAIGNSFACWSFKTDAYDWQCKCISGTCVTTAP